MRGKVPLHWLMIRISVDHIPSSKPDFIGYSPTVPNRVLVCLGNIHIADTPYEAS